MNCIVHILPLFDQPPFDFVQSVFDSLIHPNLCNLIPRGPKILYVTVV